jgi:hypothetical protein
MKKILLHVGHPKTGTSYIQSFLAINRHKLADYNIMYPYNQSLEKAKAGRTTPGNINIDNLGCVDDYIAERAAASGLDSVLFSSEFLFRAMLHNRHKFDSLCKHFDVVVILFIRDPFEHAISMYGHAVKKGRATVSVDEHIRGYNTPWLVSDLIDIVRGAGASLVVKNYSNYRRCILRAFLPAINLEERGFAIPSVQDVNRSLSPSEINVQIAFNRYFGPRAFSFVSEPLVNGILLSRKIGLTTTRETYDYFVGRMADIVLAVNQKLPDGERYSLSAPNHFSDQADTKHFVNLSDRQIDVIASAIHTYIHKLETRNHKLETKLRRSRLRLPYLRIRRLFKKLMNKRDLDRQSRSDELFPVCLS